MVNEVIQGIMSITDRAALRQIGDALRMRWGQIDEIAGMQFKVGDRVQFVGKGHKIAGVVTKVNRRTLKVKQDNTNIRWAVSTGLAEKVQA